MLKKQKSKKCQKNLRVIEDKKFIGFSLFFYQIINFAYTYFLL